MKYFNFIVALLLSALYLMGKIPPTERFNLWFTNFTIPVAMLANTVLFVYSGLLRRKSALFYLVPLIIGFPYFVATISIKKYFHFSKPNGREITVLNHNISNFSLKSFYYRNADSARLQLKEFMTHPTTDIQCYQEFTNFPSSKNFNTVAELQKAGLYVYFSQEDEKPHSWSSRIGTLIVSRFPIVSSGDVMASDNGFNRVAYADVAIGKDTVRIINTHLESMGLGQYAPSRQRDIEAVSQSTRTLISKLKEGVFERSRQVRQLAEFVDQSPYPVICAGDFNEMPYSYAYQFLRKRLKNAFEESGSGFGFTYHGGTLKALRIDNQFYSSPIISTDLTTRYDVELSDHFPVQGTYVLPAKDR